jgi:hypothetical protein
MSSQEETDSSDRSLFATGIGSRSEISGFLMEIPYLVLDDPFHSGNPRSLDRCQPISINFIEFLFGDLKRKKSFGAISALEDGYTAH